MRSGSRRTRPADDLTTDLTQAEIVGSDGESERLTDDEIVAFCLLLGVAGNETTAKMIATGTVVLAQFPDERSRMVENPALWPNAVEELLCFDPPSHYQGRVAVGNFQCLLEYFARFGGANPAALAPNHQPKLAGETP